MSDEAGHHTAGAASRSRKRREVGKDLVPALGGGGASLGGVALLGPPGALLGALTTVALKRLMARIDRLFADAAEEFAARQLGPGEQRRVALAYNRAAERLVERLRAGEGLRDDGFFDAPRAEDDRTAAEEALEGVLAKARDAYEQRKAERLGELVAFLAVSPDISSWHGNYLIELALALAHLASVAFAVSFVGCEIALIGQCDLAHRRSGLASWRRGHARRRPNPARQDGRHRTGWTPAAERRAYAVSRG